ncbi:MAG: type I-E CRISPR-associated endonuclease Cas1 [Candidatus Fermentibacteraceae bacterium]|nr:type I-E CRISPR-associated endonuclease Cas1 [Candidatus Fermentibacteraceae bacterium]MBN2609311.1 type I-E CRISPR-associated endonuclease Cas1 [Candidatus Fermentibacteraceae bacterium]
MLPGRLGLETARIPHADRHGLLWLYRGNLTVKNGTLQFTTAGYKELESGVYAIPFQTVSVIMLGPGCTVSHDALRILARHNTGLIAIGEGGVRYYASMPFGPDESRLARKQVMAWAEVTGRKIDIVRRMYAWRLGEIFPAENIEVLRGMEGARVKTMYKRISEQYDVPWHGRRYDRSNPNSADLPNQAINHAASAVEGAAMIAVAATGTIPQLGFIHEDSGISFCLDIADLFRDEITVPVAFKAVTKFKEQRNQSLESITRRLAGRAMHEKQVIPNMIDRIKKLFEDTPTKKSY